MRALLADQCLKCIHLILLFNEILQNLIILKAKDVMSLGVPA